MFKICILGYGCIYDSAASYDRNKFIQEPVLNMQDANGAGSFKFKIGKDIDGYSEIDLLKTTIYITRKEKNSNTEKIIWAGRVLEESRDEYNDRVIECEGALAYLNDSIQPYSRITALSDADHFKSIIDFHNSLMTDESRKFDITDLMASTNSYLTKIRDELRPDSHQDILYAIQTREPKSTLELLKEQFLDRWGGYFKLSYELINNGRAIKNKLDYIDAYDPVMNPEIKQSIEYGLNLVSLKRSAYADDFATILYPMGATLDDVQKSYVYCEHDPNQMVAEKQGYYKRYGNLPGSYTSETYSWQALDPNTGYAFDTRDPSYATTKMIPVSPGERYFLTTYLKGIPVTGAYGQSKDNDGSTAIGAAVYAIYKSNKSETVQVGQSVTNSVSKNEQTSQVTEQLSETFLEDYEITIPEDGAFLVVAIYDPHHLYSKFRLKKFNPEYDEETVSIISISRHSATSTDPIVKSDYYPEGWDVYPGNTGTNARVESFFDARVIKHSTLLAEFGPIIKIIEFDEAPYNNPDYLYRKSCEALRRMTEKVELEVEAVDLSFIDEGYESFDILSLVPIHSDPHSLSTSLPILRLEIPLDSPEKAKYTLANEVETRDGTPSYMTVYMSDMYKKGRA